MRVASLQGTLVTDWREILDISNFWNTGGRAHFDVHPGGDRFLFLKKSEGDDEPMLHVVINWQGDL